jgi:hypothetical protein
VSDVVQLAGGIDKAQARARIDRWLNEYAEGTSNHKAEAIVLAKQAELDAEVVEARFAGADKLRAVGETAALGTAIAQGRKKPERAAKATFFPPRHNLQLRQHQPLQPLRGRPLRLLPARWSKARSSSGAGWGTRSQRQRKRRSRSSRSG